MPIFVLIKRIILPALFAGSVAASGFIMPAAHADEIWMSDGKMIQWLESKGDTAVFKMNHVYFYIEGLASAGSDNRGTYLGYWVTKTNAQRKCATFRELHNGRMSYTWGRFRINFIGSTFPYKWTGRLGECDRKPYKVMEAIPMMQAN